VIEITASQLVAHAIGDYVLQSDYMATEKTKATRAALAHVICYALPFLMLTRSWKALLFITSTHFVIDRWRLARYVVWAKEWLTFYWRRPKPFAECAATGYDPEKPLWMSVWLMIIADNLMHVLLNAVALRWLNA